MVVAGVFRHLIGVKLMCLSAILGRQKGLGRESTDKIISNSVTCAEQAELVQN